MMHRTIRLLTARPRRGFSLIDVALATVIMTSGTLFMGAYFRNLYDKLDPRGSYGGLRRYIVAEQILRGEAEGLRVLKTIPNDAGSCEVVTPPGLYALEVDLSYVSPVDANGKLNYMDLVVTYDGQSVSTLSMSTLRPTGSTNDDKIGL